MTVTPQSRPKNKAFSHLLEEIGDTVSNAEVRREEKILEQDHGVPTPTHTTSPPQPTPEVIVDEGLSSEMLVSKDSDELERVPTPATHTTSPQPTTTHHTPPRVLDMSDMPTGNFDQLPHSLSRGEGIGKFYGLPVTVDDIVRAIWVGSFGGFNKEREKRPWAEYSIIELGNVAGLSHRTIERRVPKMKDLELVVVKSGKDRGKKNRYWLTDKVLNRVPTPPHTTYPPQPTPESGEVGIHTESVPFIGLKKVKQNSSLLLQKLSDLGIKNNDLIFSVLSEEDGREYITALIRHTKKQGDKIPNPGGWIKSGLESFLNGDPYVVAMARKPEPTVASSDAETLKENQELSKLALALLTPEKRADILKRAKASLQEGMPEGMVVPEQAVEGAALDLLKKEAHVGESNKGET